MIPGLENAEFVRYGVMHRNTFLNSPKLLDEHYRLKSNPDIYFAGQMTGVEGYIESAASGLTAGLDLAMRLCGREAPVLPADTAIGALAQYVSHGSMGVFQPMNINFGILPALGERVKGKRERYLAISERSLASLADMINTYKI